MSSQSPTHDFSPQQTADTHHVVRLRLSDQNQDVGADDGQAEVEQDDGSFGANISEGENPKQSGVISAH